MDSYFDCPCGHAHHEHNWHSRGESLSRCMADGCSCWTYHGHRVGDKPHTVVRQGLVAPTEEMRTIQGVMPVPRDDLAGVTVTWSDMQQ